MTSPRDVTVAAAAMTSRLVLGRPTCPLQRPPPDGRSHRVSSRRGGELLHISFAAASTAWKLNRQLKNIVANVYRSAPGRSTDFTD